MENLFVYIFPGCQGRTGPSDRPGHCSLLPPPPPPTTTGLASRDNYNNNNYINNNHYYWHLEIIWKCTVQLGFKNNTLCRYKIMRERARQNYIDFRVWGTNAWITIITILLLVLKPYSAKSVFVSCIVSETFTFKSSIRASERSERALRSIILLSQEYIWLSWLIYNLSTIFEGHKW